uniref:Uncharacterized protein n=1 Tax=Oryza barthii TaxID=65489 RepID=A0A0D3FKW2_9ORYZ
MQKLVEKKGIDLQIANVQNEDHPFLELFCKAASNFVKMSRLTAACLEVMRHGSCAAVCAPGAARWTPSRRGMASRPGEKVEGRSSTVRKGAWRRWRGTTGWVDSVGSGTPDSGSATAAEGRRWLAGLAHLAARQAGLVGWAETEQAHR